MAADGEYVRWVNSKELGALVFVTTTVLGYTPALRKDAEKARILALLAKACRHHGALLHAFCVMDHHLHLVIRAPLDMTMSKFMQSFKRHAAVAMLDSATPWIRNRLREVAKDGRSFWMRSFRGVRIRREEVFWRCITYVHLNPVRAGMCEGAEEYRWSSALLFEGCQWTEDEGVLPCLP